MKWSVPKIWEGKTVAILASGPSMSQEVADKVRAKGIPTIAINTTFRLAPWADMLYAADPQWWEAYWNKLDGFVGLRVTSTVAYRPELLSLEVTRYDGFEPDTGKMASGGNSGYQAIHIAMHAGATRIELYGYDMQAKGQHQHWHGLHPLTLRNHGSDIYVRWLRAFAALAPIAKGMGVQIVNCTPGSALTCFDRGVDGPRSFYG